MGLAQAGLRPRIGSLQLPIAYALVGLAFFVVYLFSYPRNWNGPLIFNSPRENVGYVLVQQYVKGSGLQYPLRHYDSLPKDVSTALTPRDAAVRDGNVVPKDFAGTIVLYAVALSLAPHLVLVISPLFGVLSAGTAIRICQTAFGQDVDVLAFLLVLTLPPLWINAAYIFMGDTVSLFFVLLSVFFLLKYWRSARSTDAALLGASLSLAVLFRYPNAFLIPVILLLVFVGKRFRVDHATLAAVAAVPAGIVILLFNWYAYGHPLTTGFHLGAALLAESANFTKESFLKVRPEVAVEYVQTYGTVHALAIPVAIGVITALVTGWRERGAGRLLSLLVLTIFGFLAIYYGMQDAWGFGDAYVNASLLRYLLPGLTLLVGVGVYGLSRFFRATKVPPVIRHAVMFAMILANIAYAYGGAQGIKDGFETGAKLEATRSEILSATEADAIVATRLLDKTLFPSRQTMTLTYALKNKEPVDKGKRQTWQFVPGPERLASVARTVTEQNIPFYVVTDGFFGPLPPYERAFAEEGLQWSRVNTIHDIALYRVTSRKADEQASSGE
jgi:hypothetical protein